MQGFLIWGGFTIAVAVSCVWRPQRTRVFVGVFFVVMALGVHGSLILTDPHRYVDFADSAPWAPYREVGLWLTEPNPVLFGIGMLVLELGIAALILARGRAVTWGLLGAIAFVVGITPLGLEEAPNVIFAAGLGFLLGQDFPVDAWTMAHHGRHRPTGTVGVIR